MNIEKFPSVSNKIEADNKKERKEKLLENIEKIALVFASKKFIEAKESDPSYKLSQAIAQFTPTRNIVENSLYSLVDFDYHSHKGKIDEFFAKMYREIDDAYILEEDNIDDIFAIIDSRRKEIKKYLGVENLKSEEKGKHEEGTKIFRFNEVDNLEEGYSGRYYVLEKYGFSRFDKFLELHASNFFEISEDNSLGLNSIEDDFKKISEHIIESSPEVRAVVGKSWLMDTPLASKLGFNKIEEKSDDDLNNFSSWFQFIDKNGEISKPRLDKLILKGEVPYKSSLAYIKTEDFLARYLSAEKKGNINLKKLREERAIFWHNLKEKSISVGDNWDKSVNEGLEFSQFLSKEESLSQILNVLSPKSRKVYLDFLQIMFKGKAKWKDLQDNKGVEIKKIDEEFKKIKSDDLYEDSEIKL